MQQHVQLRYFGYSTFILARGDVSVLFDPYAGGKRWSATQTDALKPKYILVSRARLGDTLSLAKRTGAAIVSTPEIANCLREQGCNCHLMNIGSEKRFEFGCVRVTPSSCRLGAAGGFAVGFVVDFYGTTIYFAGDTALFDDMKVIGKARKIDYAFLPIGDHFTLGARDATEALKLLKPRFVIPMFYDRGNNICHDPERYKEIAEKSAGVPVIIVKPGCIHTIPAA